MITVCFCWIFSCRIIFNPITKSCHWNKTNIDEQKESQIVVFLPLRINSPFVFVAKFLWSAIPSLLKIIDSQSYIIYIPLKPCNDDKAFYFFFFLILSSFFMTKNIMLLFSFSFFRLKSIARLGSYRKDFFFCNVNSWQPKAKYNRIRLVKKKSNLKMKRIPKIIIWNTMLMLYEEN
jgi:hypothetical protein